MDPKKLKKRSKFLSFVLRHKPEHIGIVLDAQGWTDIGILLKKAAEAKVEMSKEELHYIVAHNNKKRFSINDAGSHIRASQGHSIEIALGYTPSQPPEELFHGTVPKFLDSIREKGLLKGNRHHVHLSQDIETARQVGSRRGAPIILTVKSGAMHRAGHAFFISSNGVWLTEHIPPIFLV